MAVPPHHGVMGSHCTGFLDQSNYPQPTGTRPLVVQTVVLFLSGMYITANLLVDVLYAYLNPRIRYGA
jgi:ABC-type dipeptide/oligopeptide/nickel transport system permease component